MDKLDMESIFQIDNHLHPQMEIPKDTPASHNGRAKRPIHNPKG